MAEKFDFQTFIRECNLAGDEERLFAILDDATRRLGFDQFAMGHHVDLLGPPEDAIRLTTYHPDWIETALGRGYYRDDPVHAASARTAVGFLWSDVPNLIQLTARQKKILQTARKYGLSGGFTVPVHVPGEYRGTCSFGAASLDRLCEDALPSAQLVSSFAFEAARRIMRARHKRTGTGDIPALTGRQLDCITLVATGKTDWEIGRILGISQATAHEHVENARQRYGVAKRSQLVVRALFDGQISFSDILN